MHFNATVYWTLNSVHHKLKLLFRCYFFSVVFFLFSFRPLFCRLVFLFGVFLFLFVLPLNHSGIETNTQKNHINVKHLGHWSNDEKIIFLFSANSMYILTAQWNWKKGNHQMTYIVVLFILRRSRVNCDTKHAMHCVHCLKWIEFSAGTMVYRKHKNIQTKPYGCWMEKEIMMCVMYCSLFLSQHYQMCVCV